MIESSQQKTPQKQLAGTVCHLSSLSPGVSPCPHGVCRASPGPAPWRSLDIDDVCRHDLLEDLIAVATFVRQCNSISVVTF